jgi:carbamoyltransferase
LKILSIYLKHDTSVAIYANNSLHVIELEKIYDYKGFPFLEGGGWWPSNVDKFNWHSYNYLRLILNETLLLAKNTWGIENNFDLLLYNWIKDQNFVDVLKKTIRHHKIKHIDHQYSHANCAFFQSPFEESHVFTIDGWGNDGSFHIYKFNKKENNLLKKINISLGLPYAMLGIYLPQINYKEFHEDGKRTKYGHLAGKVMGLCGYGEVQSKWIEPIKEFFLSGYISREYMKESLFKNLKINNKKISEGEGVDLAATFQYVFENIFLDSAHDYLVEAKNICISGGCGLNILLCEKIRTLYNKQVYVPCNSSDCGIPVGMTLSELRPSVEERFDTPYMGVPFVNDIETQKKQEIKTKDLIELLLEEKIIGVIFGTCECGPRALGNRSMLCLCTIKDLKTKLNNIKKRESFRPFGVMVCEDDAEVYFHFKNQKSPYMNFCPYVKNEWKEKIAGVVHVDGTCRIQTLEKSHRLYAVLKELKNKTGIGLLVNTSLNIKGEPLVNKMSKAMSILNDTPMDCLIVENNLFQKNKLFI